MRWYSTYHSARAGKVTVLAVIETIGASILGVWLAISIFESWVPLGIMVISAPLYLTRTERVEKKGRKMVGKMEIMLAQSTTDLPDKWLEEENLGKSIAGILLWVPGLILGLIGDAIRFFFIRIIAVFSGVSIDSLLSIPRNWTRICFHTDVCHPVVLFPTDNSENDISDTFDFKTGIVSWGIFANEDSKSDPLSQRIFVFVLMTITVFPVLFLQPALHRLSIKATAIVWLPFIWIIQKATKVYKDDLRANIRIFAELLYKDPWSRFVLIMSIFTILSFLVKILVFSVIDQTGEMWAKLELPQDLYAFIEPYSIPLWQWVGVTNACLGVAMFFWSGRLLLKDRNDLLPDSKLKGIDNTFRTGKVIRLIFTLFTSACLLYILLQKDLLISLPPLGKLVPWS